MQWQVRQCLLLGGVSGGGSGSSESSYDSVSADGVWGAGWLGVEGVTLRKLGIVVAGKGVSLYGLPAIVSAEGLGLLGVTDWEASCLVLCLLLGSVI